MTAIPTDTVAAAPYILGHADDELDRLIFQARYLGDLTEQFLRQTGLAPGMRVLDAGCGTGDVTFLAAGLVGSSGAVVGVDRSPEAVAVAQRRAQEAGRLNVQFRVADLDELTLETPVDAVIGRLVLLYLPDPAATLRRLCRWLEPGGIVAFQEYDMGGWTSDPPVETFAFVARLIDQTFDRAGLDRRVGLKLRRIFAAAGLPAPRMTQAARVEGGPDSPVYSYLAQTTRTLLPRMEQAGVATAGEVGVETLATRLRDETVAKEAVLVTPPLIGAWARRGQPGRVVR
jgi:ubiquinone/menaquinone biosynthesis C-methylase UbiE